MMTMTMMLITCRLQEHVCRQRYYYHWSQPASPPPPLSGSALRQHGLDAVWCCRWWCGVGRLPTKP
eukprot:3766525-Rhodomonas_salina.1